MAARRCYTVDDVKQAIRTYHRISSFRKTSRIMGIPKSTVHDWVTRIGNRCTSRQRQRRRKKRLREAIQPTVSALISSNPFHTIRSIQVALQPIMVSIATIHRAIHGCGKRYLKVSWRTPPRDILLAPRYMWVSVHKP